MNRAASPKKVEDRFTKLTERQRIYLRHVFQHRNSKEIARLENTSPRSVDKQLILAKDILGAEDRFEAARMLAVHEAGVERFYPASILPSVPEYWPLPSPLPNLEKAVSPLSWRQLAVWAAIIAIATPIALGSATMLLFALSYLIGANPH